MFPITIFYAGTLGLLMAVLSIRVPMRRLKLNTPWGDGEDSTLATRIRVFGNFIEYVPILIVTMALLESSGAPSTYLHGTGAALVIARLIHAFSLNSTEAQPWRRAGRAVGAFTTWLVLVSHAAYALILAG